MISQHTVVAMSGEEARKTFFNEKRLSFTQGYQLLMGGVSQILERHVPF
jgi:sterol 14-demethylase